MQLDKNKFKDIATVGNKTFGYLKLSEAKLSINNIRPETTKEETEVIRVTLLPSIDAIGMQQLPVSSPKGEIFIGGRRLKAYEIKKEQWLAVEIRDVDDLEQMRASWAENRARQEVKPMEEARHFKKMVDAKGLSGRQLAHELGLSEDYVQRRLKWVNTVLHGTEVVKGTGKQSEVKMITEEKMDALTSDWVEPKVQDKLIEKITTEGMTKQQVQSATGEIKKIQITIEQEPDQKFKEQLEKEFGGEKVFEHTAAEVEDKRKELHKEKPVMANESLSIDDFLQGQTITVNIPQDVMARIVKYYLDKQGRYTGYKITVEGQIARSKKVKK